MISGESSACSMQEDDRMPDDLRLKQYEVHVKSQQARSCYVLTHCYRREEEAARKKAVSY
jgi:hypothetical protein